MSPPNDLIPIDLDLIKLLRMSGRRDEAQALLDQHHKNLEEARAQDKKEARSILAKTRNHRIKVRGHLWIKN